MHQLDEQKERDVLAALDRYANTVRRICYLYFKSATDVDDIFQEVFLRYLQREEPFASLEHEKAWIIRVAINCSKDVLGSFWRRHVVPLDESVPASMPIEQGEVMEAVMKLPDRERTIVYLFYCEGYPATEIAKIMNLKLNTVYSHMHRGRARLRTLLGGMQHAKPNPGCV